MSLDDRLRSRLRGSDTTVDPARALEAFLTTARPRRARRRTIAGATVALVLVAGAAGAAAVVGSLDRGESFVGTRCRPDQYTLRLAENQMRFLAGPDAGRWYQLPSVTAEPLGREPDCVLTLTAALTVVDGAGGPVQLEGNGTENTDPDPVDTPFDALFWQWTNWCGSREGLRYEVRSDDTLVLSEPVTMLPDCLDEEDASVLTVRATT